MNMYNFNNAYIILFSKIDLNFCFDRYVYYCMKYLEYMLKNNLKPIMVFDGCHLPSKKDVEKNRRE